MAAGTSTPVEAGQGPSVLGIAASIGAKIRDAAQDAKEQREKAAEKGETPKKGSLFKSALANQFNPIKSKKAKSNWAKQFDWNKTTKSDQQVKPPTGGGGGGEGKAKLKEFIAGGFTAILKDTGMMVSKLDGVKMMAGENLSEVTRASSTLTVIKDSIDTQTELRRRALDEAKFARAEKKLEKTSDSAGVSDTKKPEDKGDGKGEDDGGGLLENLANALGIADLVDNFFPGKKGKPGRNPLSRLNPFNRQNVTQGRGGQPAGPRLGGGPRITTSGGAPAPKPPGGFKLPKMPGLPKGIRPGSMGGPLTALFAGLEFAGRKSEGQNNLQAGVGTAGSVGGGLAGAALGAKGGALAGAAIGALFGGVGAVPGAAIGGALGGILGGIGGSMGGGKLADMATGADNLSEGGIVPSAVPPSPVSPMAKGGIAPGLYDNPTKGILSPGQSVIPLNRSEGKSMFGKSAATNPGETAIDTVGAMILGVSAGMLGKTDSGTVGDQVKQNIRKASKEFGISNLTFTSAIGNAQFGKVKPDKDAKDFMMSLFSNIKIAMGSGGGKGKSGGGGSTPEAGSVAEQAKTMEGKTASEAVGFMDEQDKILTKAGVPNAVYGSADVMGDVIDQHWCASFVASVLASKGYKPPNSAFADAYRADGSSLAGTPGWGENVDPKDAKPGDVITFDYDGKDNIAEHVAIVTANDGKNITYVGGNQGGGSPRNSKVTEGTIAVGDKTLFKITRPKETLGTTTAQSSGNKDAQQLAQGVAQKLQTPAATGASSLGDPSVTQIAQRGIVSKAENGMFGPSWAPWNLGKLVDNQRKSNKGIGAEGRYNNVTDPEIRRMMGLPPLKGYASGGKEDSARQHAARLRAQRASQQRSRLGVQKVNGKWVNMGVSDQAVGSNPWWQVWNKKGATAERKAKQEALAKSLAERLNKQEAALKPKPAPARSPASGSGSRPRSSASSAASSSTTAVVMPPTQPSGASATAEGSFGSAIPSAKTSAMVFADFLYPDLV